MCYVEEHITRVRVDVSPKHTHERGSSGSLARPAFSDQIEGLSALQVEGKAVDRAHRSFPSPVVEHQIPNTEQRHSNPTARGAGDSALCRMSNPGGRTRRSQTQCRRPARRSTTRSP